MTTLNKLSKNNMGEERDKCTLHCGDRVFIMNKKLLCSRSLYFKTMFQCGMQESLSNEVTINDITPEVLEFVLHYIDKKKFPTDLDEDLLLETLSASHMLMVDGLTDDCGRQVVVTESNYLTVLDMNEMYRNSILIENTLKFQAKHFREKRSDLLSHSCNELKFLLINTTIDATVDEIIVFLLTWAKSKKESVQSLCELFSLVDFSSISDESLNQYLNNEPLICENLDIKNALKEKANIDQLHFLFRNNEEFQTYCVKTKQWSSVHDIPKKFDFYERNIFYVKDDYYVIEKNSNSVVVMKLSSDLSRIVSNKYLDIKFDIIFVINNTIWFFSRSIHVYDPLTEEHKILPIRLLEEFTLDNWASFYLHENHLFFFPGFKNNYYTYLDLNLDSYQWKKVTLPPLPVSEELFDGYFMASCSNHLYFFLCSEVIDTLEFKKYGEETKDDFLKRIEGKNYRYSVYDDVETYKIYSPDAKIFKLLSDNTWEEIVLDTMSFSGTQLIAILNFTNRKIPFIFFHNCHKIFQLDVRNYEWHKIIDSVPEKYYKHFTIFFKQVL